MRRHQDISSPGCLPWLLGCFLSNITYVCMQPSPTICLYKKVWQISLTQTHSGFINTSHQSCVLKRFETCIALARSPTFAVQCKQHQQCAEYPCFDWHMQALLWLTVCILFQGLDLRLAERCSNTNHPPAHSLYFIHTDTVSALMWLSNDRCC